MGEFQHCQACATEYVAGVSACADCGGALTPGPLPEGPSNDSDQRRTDSAAAPTPDTKLTDLPGLQADFAVRALTLEGIVCGLECQGIRKIRLPDGPPEEPLAVTLPVSIYVPSDRLSEAQSILRSLEPDDIIGAQWEAVPEDAEAVDTDFPSSSGGPRPPLREDPEAEPFPTPGPAQGESTTLRLILLLIVAALVVFALAR